MAGSENSDRRLLEALAEAEGLYLVGIVRPEYPEAASRFSQWIQSGKHAGMAFLENHPTVRADPRQYFAETQSVLVFCMSYWHPGFETIAPPKVAGYARFRDYHKVLREKCTRIMEQFHRQTDSAKPYRVAVDSAPILERALAAQAARGFIGKNTLWIHPDFGSLVVLAEVFTALEFEADEKAAAIPLDRKTNEGGCGPCRQCQVSCPTGALDSAYQLDATKCLSYWTIENRGTIPFEFWPHLREFYFGCDLCQTACPYNIRPKKRLLAPTDMIPQLNWILFIVATMDQQVYERMFGGTPMTRAKRSGLRRNALIAMAVTGHPQLAEALEHVAVDGGYPLEETAAQVRQWLDTQAALHSGATQPS
jgi:epoxyqueuosine reductase